jgi:lipopolysaccharide transport system permease protein
MSSQKLVMNTYQRIIEPGRTNKNYWLDLWRFRELFLFLSWRDILVRYKQTAVGIAWSVLRPALTLTVMAFIGWLFKSNVPTGVPRLLLVGTATLPWTFFSTAFSDSAGSLVSNSNLITKIYFPRLIIPMSAIAVCLVDLLISFSILAGMMVFYGYGIGARILFLPLFIVLAILVTLGSGLFVAALNVKYRDFRYIVPFIVQFGLYVSPVAFSSADIYSSHRIPSLARFAYSMNPMVAVIDGFRWCLLGGSTSIHRFGFGISIAVTIAVLIYSLRYFRSAEKAFADVI